MNNRNKVRSGKLENKEKTFKNNKKLKFKSILAIL